MKKIWILAFLVFLPVVFGYVKPVDYNGIQLKFYSDEINQTRCIETLDSIPQEYYEGIKYLKFFPYGSNKKVWGFYWFYGIDTFNDCGIDVIIHELAHHCQRQRGDLFFELIFHKGKFHKCEEEIWGRI